MKTPENSEKNGGTGGLSGSKPDFSKMSGDELENYLEIAAERITANVSEGKNFKIEVFWIQDCCVFLGKNLDTQE